MIDPLSTIDPFAMDPANVPEHVRRFFKQHPIARVLVGGKGKRLTVEVCRLCGTNRLVSMRSLADTEAPNEVESVFWSFDMHLCPLCGPIFARYPEVAHWVRVLLAWGEFATNPRAT